MSFVLFNSLLCVGLFVGTLVAVELGRRVGRRRIPAGEKATSEGTGIIDAAVFGLLGLLLAFTFSGAADRFDARKRLIIDETNAIGTAYLRVDLLDVDAQPAVRASFRAYLDARVEIYRRLPDLAAARQELGRSKKIEQAIWQQATAAYRDSPTYAPILLTPALNSMFDIANTRTLTTMIHPPIAIFVMLGAIVLVSGLFAGYGMTGARRSWMHELGLALSLSITVYVILELEYPRLGLIRLDAFDRALLELRQAMR